MSKTLIETLKHKRKCKIYTLHDTSDKTINELKKFGEGKTMLVVKAEGMNPQREIFEERWRAIEKALKIKGENPQLTVRLIMY